MYTIGAMSLKTHVAGQVRTWGYLLDKDLQHVPGAMANSVNNLATWIESASEDDMLREVTAPWGMKLTLADLLLHASAHMAYHSGQVNFVQLLHGDDTMHWM